MRIHGYVRASIRRQELSPAVQQEKIEQHCQAMGWPKPLIYVDKATSSRILISDRTAGAQLSANVVRGDKILITKLDRAFRNTRECLAHMEIWSGGGVEVHILNFMGGAAVEFTAPLGKMMLTIIAAFAEFERDLARERTKEALAYARRQGGGGGQARFGFKHVKVMIDGQPKKRQVRDEEERKQMKLILRLRNEDQPWSFDQIRQHLNFDMKWHRSKKWGSEKHRQWSISSIRRACIAEAILQYREVTQLSSKPGANSEQ